MARVSVLALRAFGDAGLSEADLLGRMAWLREVIGPRIERFMGYYRNPTTELAAALPCAANASFSVRPFRQYQELGLPARITGFRCAANGALQATGMMDVQRKEVVIENDIAWRINTLVDFAAGRMPSVTSTARDPAVRAMLTRVIESLLNIGEESDGAGLAFWQRMVLQGAIAGTAWVHVRPTGELLETLGRKQPTAGSETAAAGGAGVNASDQGIAPEAGPRTSTGGGPVDVARWLAVEVVEASRLCPLPAARGVCAAERRTVAGALDDAPAYVAVLNACAPAASGGEVNGGPGIRGGAGEALGIFERMRSWFGRPALLGLARDPGASAEEFSFDLFGPTHWQRYVRGVLTEEGENLLGAVPFVRYENADDPAAGWRVGAAGSGAVDVGMGEIEPLIGLQDELNTRLSDRASRVTMTCFRMYLGRGIEDFTKRPVGPGQMWSTDNANASIESFGGDASMPSEESHINEVREALDKISGVSPIAAGLIRGKLGNLTSAVALRLTLIALLARTEHKRAGLTSAMAKAVRMALAILDRAGIVKSAPEDRGIDVNWPTPLPESDIDRLQEAQVKVALGVPRGVVLTELGYGELAEDAAVGDGRGAEGVRGEAAAARGARVVSAPGDAAAPPPQGAAMAAEAMAGVAGAGAS